MLVQCVEPTRGGNSRCMWSGEMTQEEFALDPSCPKCGAYDSLVVPVIVPSQAGK